MPDRTVKATVIGKVAKETGYFLLVEPPSSRLAVARPKPMYIGVDARRFDRARPGDSIVIGGEGA